MMKREETRARAALALAVQRIGGVVATADALGISKGAVSRWDVCPPARVLDVERLSGIPRHDLRPDYYPDGGDR